MSADPAAAALVLLSWAATYFVHSTALLAGAWLFVKWHGAAEHAFRETLWKTALVGGVLTATFQIWLVPVQRFADFNFRMGRVSAPAGLGVTEASGTCVAKDDRASAPLSEGRFATAVESGMVAADREIWIAPHGGQAGDPRMAPRPAADRARESFPAARAAPLPDTFRVPDPNVEASRVLPFVLLILATPVCLGLANCLRQTLSLRQRLASCAAVEDGPARRLLDELLLSVPRTPDVLLLAAPGDVEPAALGLGRWTIVLPERAIAELSPDELRALLAHELAHLARGDALWLCIGRLACSLLAFQPLNHLARREWQRAAEFLCDNWAVSRTGAPLALARCLATVAGWHLSSGAAAASLAATGRRSGLVDRIERLLDARPRPESWNERGAGPRGLLIAAAVLAAFIAAAPRIQLAWGEAPAKNEADALLAEIDTELFQVALGEGSNEAHVAVADVQEESSVPDGAPLERVASEQASPASIEPLAIQGLLVSLNRDLEALESELRELEPLMRESGDARVIAAVRRLKAQIKPLRDRRKVLERAWSRLIK